MTEFLAPHMAVISLVVLAIVVAIGFIKKVNLGFLSLGVAFVLAIVGGLKAKDVTGGFSSSMFVTLVGVTFLFGMASQNGTLDLFSKKIVALVGKHTVLIPILMFVLSAFISAIGPGHIAAGILMTTFAMYLAFEMNINPWVTVLFAKLGANAGCASPLSLTGLLAKELSEPMGYTGFEAHLFLSTLLSGFIFTLIIYIGSKSYKVKADNPLKWSDIPKFNRNQKLTMAAIVIMVVCCIGFKFDTGLFAFIMASVLILLGAADEKAAVPILAATSGILSWASSTTGVVMPALFPVADQVAQQFAGVNYVELISAITATSFAAAISPLSIGGAIIMSSYSASKETTNEEMNKLFTNLFLLSVANVLVNVLMSALGVFSLGGLFS